MPVRSQGGDGAGLATLLRNLLSASSDMPSDGIHSGSEKGDLEIHGDGPLKQKGSRWALEGGGGGGRRGGVGAVADVIP